MSSIRKFVVIVGLLGAMILAAVPTFAAKPKPTPTPAPAATNTVISPTLVLVTGDTALLSGPNGSSLNANAKHCQTFFAVEISADKLYYKLYITPKFSAWISAAAVQPVAANYGQRNGQSASCK